MLCGCHVRRAYRSVNLRKMVGAYAVRDRLEFVAQPQRCTVSVAAAVVVAALYTAQALAY